MDRAGDLGVAFFLRAAGDVDDAAVRAERDGDALAGAAARAGDDGDYRLLAHFASPIIRRVVSKRSRLPQGELPASIAEVFVTLYKRL